MKRILVTAFLISALIGAILPGAVLAAAPTNDAFADATVIDPSALPFSDIVDNTEATIEPGETDACGYAAAHTVWYRFDASADSIVRFDTEGTSFYDRKLDLYQATGPSIADLSLLACGGFGDALLLQATAGTTYYARAQASWSGGGTIRLNATLVVAPLNDDFSAAKPIGSLPFTDTVDLTAATDQGGEPVPPCASGFSGQSAWYVYDAPTSGSVSTSFNTYAGVVGMYRGTTLGSLLSVGCASWYNTLTTIHVDAGQRYYFQLIGSFQAVGITTFQLQVAPAPSAVFNYYPGDPSTFETVQFSSNQYDPGNVGISTWAWSFGDGTTATTANVQHRFASDGDYTVSLTVGTPDGRTATESQTVRVRTHDIAITKFTVPSSASAGQTRSITVGITNRRYAEPVSVILYKITPSGLVFVGSANQSVPVRSGNRTTDFAFSYTFVSDDAVTGKVSFMAVATITNARDAIPGDNQAQSLPTKVNK